MVSAGILVVLERHGDNAVPTFWALLWGYAVASGVVFRLLGGI